MCDLLLIMCDFCSKSAISVTCGHNQRCMWLLVKISHLFDFFSAPPGPRTTRIRSATPVRVIWAKFHPKRMDFCKFHDDFLIQWPYSDVFWPLTSKNSYFSTSYGIGSASIGFSVKFCVGWAHSHPKRMDFCVCFFFSGAQFSVRFRDDLSLAGKKWVYLRSTHFLHNKWVELRSRHQVSRILVQPIFCAQQRGDSGGVAVVRDPELLMVLKSKGRFL